MLYPGSYVDVAASFVFPRLTYVDSDSRAAKFFDDTEGVDEIVSAEQTSPVNREVEFVAGDYRGRLGLDDESFDLLISLYAGFVSEHCTRYLRIGGHLLVNPSHGDAAMASIDLDATPETVWEVLIDLGKYHEWNPFIVESSGAVAPGNRLVNRMQPPGGKAATFKPRVTAVEPARNFEWLGRLGVPGIFDGRHRFELRPIPSGGTRVVHTERFRGLLVRPLRKSLDTQTLEGFGAMNAALKTRAETFDRGGS